MYGPVRLAPGKIAQSMVFDGTSYLQAGDVGKFGFLDRFTLGAWVLPENGKGGPILSRVTESERITPKIR